MKGSILLLVTAFIWGVAFVAQSAGMDYVGPFTFMFTRFLLGGAVLLPVIFFMSRGEKKNISKDKPVPKATENTATLIKGGISCGVFLCAASGFQQVGIQYTTVGKAGFITAMYILIVPLLGLFFGKKVSLKIWFCIALAIAGLYFLLMGGSNGVGMGDVLCMVCAVLFSMQILTVDYFVAKVNGVKLACIQFFTTAFISGVLMLVFEEPALNDILAAWQPILYAGIMSSGVGYTLQIVGQKYTRPAVASLVMSLESVFAALAGAAILKQIPSGREIFGCALMFAAIIISQTNIDSKRNKDL